VWPLKGRWGWLTSFIANESYDIVLTVPAGFQKSQLAKSVALQDAVDFYLQFPYTRRSGSREQLC
jgi:hypothetical protein